MTLRPSNKGGRPKNEVPNSLGSHPENLMQVPPGRISNGFIRDITDPGRPFLMGTSKETFTFRTIGAVAQDEAGEIVRISNPQRGIEPSRCYKRLLQIRMTGFYQAPENIAIFQFGRESLPLRHD
jgi:hypothetical protein